MLRRQRPGFTVMFSWIRNILLCSYSLQFPYSTVLFLHHPPVSGSLYLPRRALFSFLCIYHIIFPVLCLPPEHFLTSTFYFHFLNIYTYIEKFKSPLWTEYKLIDICFSACASVQSLVSSIFLKMWFHFLCGRINEYMLHTFSTYIFLWIMRLQPNSNDHSKPTGCDICSKIFIAFSLSCFFLNNQFLSFSYRNPCHYQNLHVIIKAWNDRK